MKRRDFLRGGSLALGGLALTPIISKGQVLPLAPSSKRAKNIIFMVSDGMSSGTLAMADLYSRRKFGRPSHWISLYEQSQVQRGLMDMASLNSIVTDSAAASSSWGGGQRVNNGSLNISPSGEEYLPILQKFKKSGKKVGCVTTVPITHATPAGFSVATKSRNSQEQIASLYSTLGFDVLLGGGSKYFDASFRDDKTDMYQKFRTKGYSVVKSKEELLKASVHYPLLGIFETDGLPYSIDHNSSSLLSTNVPTLAEMSVKAIEQMQSHPQGFVLQIEAGKVDWAAHGNDIGGLLYDQLAFDEAVGKVLDFAMKDGNTLVVITSDHGNANPGIIYGKEADKNFDRVHHFTHSNEWILQGITPSTTKNQIIERVAEANAAIRITDEEAAQLLSYYKEASMENGVYNARHLPFKLLAEIQKQYISVGWISMDHSADYTEIAMYGPGSENLKPFIRNTDIHEMLLVAAHVENKF
ncbi:alkaline phosphatase [Planobacterium oryzisoli]|uniref:Alkaline phosphatase n=1 Tax=Planobacterium oryzisoli TaxID=2771435 RepID=A0A931E7R2_9FLAO|nr:alkaline phosphatase [Planobacterium oryzisoli]MBF5026542.1 alkaline phosphatase [Planobacterium oryzisoli]